MADIFDSLNYCKAEKFYDTIKQTLSIAFAFDEEGFNVIKDSYVRFADCFYGKKTVNEVNIVNIDRCSFSPITKNELFIADFKNATNTVGIDLPIYISNKLNNCKKLVIILGEDPLRPDSEKYINLNKKHKIILSTPYGTHLRQEKNNTCYWEFSKFLLKKGYSIYYTDIKKIWIKEFGNKELKKKTKKKIPDDLLMNFIDCLKFEIELFSQTNPNYLIVTFGKDAKNSIKRMGNYDDKLIPFLHPSWSASKHWKPLFSEEINSKLKYMQKCFNQKEAEMK